MNLDKNFDIKVTKHDELKWYNPLNCDNFQIYGFPWIKKDKVYRRLPLEKNDELNKICFNCNHLSERTSGGQLHFYTNSNKVVIHNIINGDFILSGMTPIGQAGYDCYVGKDYDHLLFYGSSNFNTATKEFTSVMFDNQGNEEKLVVINFPLYCGVKFLEIGVEYDSYIKSSKYENNKKIVIYGTSITQGGCATRPGMSFTNILSRKMKQEFINLGFSGNAFGENIMASIMTEIDNVSMFIIDYEANGGTNGKLALTLEDFINTLRKKYHDVPIVVMSRIKYLFDDLNISLGIRRESIRKFQEDMVIKFNNNGDKNIYYIDGSKLLGEDYHEYTIDTIHLTDLGFMVLSKNLFNELNKIINK